MTKVIFIDVDGVLLPLRAYALSDNGGFELTATSHSSEGGPRRRAFDPVAVAMICRLVEKTGARLVWSSSWANLDQSVLERVMAENGLDAEMFDERPMTPRWHGANRAQEIDLWLQEASGAIEWIALDNDPNLHGRDSVLNKRDPDNLRRPTFSAHDGMTLGIYSQAAAILGSDESIVDWALADVRGRRRPIIFVTRQGQGHMTPLFSVERVCSGGFVVADSLWYRLGNTITDPSLLRAANRSLVGFDLTFRDAAIETLVELFPVRAQKLWD